MKVIISGAAILGVQMFYAAVLYFIHKDAEHILCYTAAEIVFTVLLHFALYVNGHIYWFIVPLGWILCIIPSLYYSYRIDPGGFLGRSFAFVLLLFFVNIPVIIASSTLAVVYRYILKK